MVYDHYTLKDSVCQVPTNLEWIRYCRISSPIVGFWDDVSY